MRQQRLVAAECLVGGEGAKEVVKQGIMATRRGLRLRFGGWRERAWRHVHSYTLDRIVNIPNRTKKVKYSGFTNEWLRCLCYRQSPTAHYRFITIFYTRLPHPIHLSIRFHTLALALAPATPLPADCGVPVGPGVPVGCGVEG